MAFRVQEGWCFLLCNFSDNYDELTLNTTLLQTLNRMMSYVTESIHRTKQVGNNWLFLQSFSISFFLSAWVSLVYGYLDNQPLSSHNSLFFLLSFFHFIYVSLLLYGDFLSVVYMWQKAEIMGTQC